MTATTMITGPHAVEVADFPRHHTCAAAKALAAWDATRGRKTEVAYQRRLERAHELLVELGAVVKRTPGLGTWLMFWLAPAASVARLETIDGSLADVLAAKCTADALEDPLQVAFARHPTRENRDRLLAAMRIEHERTGEAIARLEALDV